MRFIWGCRRQVDAIQGNNNKSKNLMFNTRHNTPTNSKICKFKNVSSDVAVGVAVGVGVYSKNDVRHCLLACSPASQSLQLVRVAAAGRALLAMMALTTPLCPCSCSVFMALVSLYVCVNGRMLFYEHSIYTGEYSESKTICQKCAASRLN